MIFDYCCVLDCLHYVEKHDHIHANTRIVYDYEIDLHLTGNRQIQINDQTYEIEADTCIFRKPGDIVTGTGMVYDAFCLTFDLCGENRSRPYHSRKEQKQMQKKSDHVLLRNLPTVFQLEDAKLAYQMFEELSHICLCGTAENDYDARKAVAEKLLLFLVSESIGLHHVGNKTRPEITEARNFISMNFAKEIQIRALAKKFGFSTEHFIRIFKKGMGYTPTEYLIHMRMENAARMLKTTRIPISEVALMCGYSNFSFFSQTFKKYYHATPLEYRKGHISFSS